MFQNHHTVIAYLFPIVPELFPDMHRYEARKGGPQTCPKGEINMKGKDSSKVTFPYKKMPYIRAFRLHSERVCPISVPDWIETYSFPESSVIL
ncbi:MAG: hypothetical protein A2029_15905 [Chloroflexi bacterium RBG_19FT_COMBO_47_9]|nr:MAG: hypothetical protein A2029_15905 [Chloroflexi bacterium RBG_19FT_COMBO_47_9]